MVVFVRLSKFSYALLRQLGDSCEISLVFGVIIMNFSSLCEIGNPFKSKK